jgi:hypothetical protein
MTAKQAPAWGYLQGEIKGKAKVMRNEAGENHAVEVVDDRGKGRGEAKKENFDAMERKDKREKKDKLRRLMAGVANATSLLSNCR